MDKMRANDPETRSADLVAEKLERLRELFPQAFHEGKVDFETLRQLLGDAVDEREETYGLDWHGKRAARRLALTPSAGTLRPRPEESVDWESTKNLMIEGDNLEVLKLLQKSFSGKVKLIYIDPPYNTGRDFVYPDDFADNIRNYLIRTGQAAPDGRRNTTSADASGRRHTDWLNMMYPRLILARTLLRRDGVLFLSIGEDEVANLIALCDEVFGSECSLGVACRVAKKSNNKGGHWAPNFDYLLTYARDRSAVGPFSGGVNAGAYDRIETQGPRKGERYQLVRLYMSTIENRNPEQRYWIDCPDGSRVIPPGATFPPERPRLGDGIWRWTKKKFEEERDRIVIRRVKSSNLLDQDKKPSKWNVFTKTYLSDVLANATSKPNSLIEAHINQIGSHEMTALGIPFDYPKPTTLIAYLCEIAQTGGDDIILDFFAGSGTTGHATIAQNAKDGARRRFILVQLPERLDPDDAGQRQAADFCARLGKPPTIAELTKERLRRAASEIRRENPSFSGDLGFRVFKLDSSNIRTWEPDGENLEESLLAAADPVKSGRSELDVLFELVLKLGLDPGAPIASKTIAGKAVACVGEGRLLACLDPAIAAGEAEALALGMAQWRQEHWPDAETTVVFSDKAFENDVAKANLTAILRRRGLEHVRSL